MPAVSASFMTQEDYFADRPTALRIFIVFTGWIGPIFGVVLSLALRDGFLFVTTLLANAWPWWAFHHLNVDPGRDAVKRAVVMCFAMPFATLVMQLALVFVWVRILHRYPGPYATQGEIVSMMVGSFIWYYPWGLYLNLSERVRAAFERHQSRRPSLLGGILHEEHDDGRLKEPSLSFESSSTDAASAPEGPQTHVTLESALRQLKSLHEQGLINEADWAEQRRVLLNRHL